jgi:hypothetical protein
VGVIEVQGVVSAATREPFVQLRQLDDEDNVVLSIQLTPMDAREVAQNIVEAAANAIYESALVAWAVARDPVNGEEMGTTLVGAVRKFRADKWGLPSNPEDWRPHE